MPLARRTTIAALVAIVAVGCRASPTRTAPQSNEPESTRSVAAPTLRYLRTENVAPSNEPARYVDVLELRNETPQTFLCASDGAGGLGCSEEVRVGDGAWQAPFFPVVCGNCNSELPPLIVDPGDRVWLMSRSWLRPTRALLRVRTANDDVPFVVSTGEYDSSLAAPGVTPRKLPREQWAEVSGSTK